MIFEKLHNDEFFLVKLMKDMPFSFKKNYGIINDVLFMRKRFIAKLIKLTVDF